MKKIAIVADSTGFITPEQLEELNIKTNYLMIIFKDQSYREFKEIDESKFIECCNRQEELPTTSQAAPGHMIELYENLFAEGYEDIIHITVSGQLSGSYSSAISCANMVNPEHIHVFDSKTIAYPQGVLAVEGAKLAQQGALVSEILKVLKKMRDQTYLSAAIYKLTNLKKGGRLSNASATIGTLLNIKPIIQVQPDGKLEAVEKVRTFKKALKSLTERAKVANLTEDYQLAIMHIDNQEAAELIREELLGAYPNHDIKIIPLSLIVAVHAGPGAVAISWVKVK